MQPTLSTFIKTQKTDTILMDGPLAQQYAEILDEQYKKEIDPQTGITLETQALDTLLSKSLWIIHKNKLNDEEAQGRNVGILYGVNSSDVAISDVIEVTDILQDTTDQRLEHSALILDDSNNELPSFLSNELRKTALEQNLPVYNNLSSYMEAQKI